MKKTVQSKVIRDFVMDVREVFKEDIDVLNKSVTCMST